MSDDPVKPALDALFSKHLAIRTKRQTFERMIQDLDFEDAKLQPKIVALSAALDTPVDPESELGKYLAQISGPGLTDGVRTVLRATETCKTPSEIRDGLLRLGYNLTEYTNILAVIHTILGRLRESGEVEKVRSFRDDGKQVGYIWKDYLEAQRPKKRSNSVSKKA